jgi:hypothetical protein
MPWFHGKISRQETEELLHPRTDGLFLVRESTSSTGDYALSVCFDKEVVHYLIEYKSGVLSFTNIVGFFPNCSSYDNLLELVEHHKRHADGLCTVLRKSLDKWVQQERRMAMAVNKSALENYGTKHMSPKEKAFYEEAAKRGVLKIPRAKLDAIGDECAGKSCLGDSIMDRPYIEGRPSTKGVLVKMAK